MKQWTRGFTLIEVLIVVLIVAILSAIAVPQYQKAVLKSRFSSLVPLGKALNEGNEAYYLEHGSYTDNVGNLDVTTQNNQAEVTLGNEPQHQYVKLTRSDIHNNLVMYQKHSTNFPGEIHCEAVEDNTQANWLCQNALKGTFVGKKNGYKVYSLNTDNPSGILGRVYYRLWDLKLTEGDVCIANGHDTCDRIRVDGGSCIAGPGSNQCAGAYTNYARCVGDTDSGHACHGSSYSGYSMCIGNGPNSCWRSSFTDHSICQANVLGACASARFSNTYDETSYCAGNFCPNGAPSSDSTKIWYRGTGEDWPADRPSELVDK